MIRIHAILFSLVTLLTLAFTMLRSARNALTVADIGGSAAYLPYYELFGTLPFSIALAWGLTWLLRKYALPKVFSITLASFVLFFLLFAWGIYPLWRAYAPFWLNSETLFLPLLSHITIGLFFVIAELWKVALISILLWGFVNSFMSLQHAKASYAPLMFGASIGGFLAGPVISFASFSPPEWIVATTLDEWHAAFSFEMVLIAGMASLSWALFILLTRLQNSEKSTIQKPKEKLRLNDCLKTTYKNPLLFSLGLIVLTDYLSYTMFEVVFLDALKSAYPTPLQYNGVMGILGQWSGLLTALAALIVGPFLANRYSWTALALVTPIGVAIGATPFLFLVSVGGNAEMAILCGCICYCIGRATKYALLDSAKEMAYIPLTDDLRMKGKLAIEGIASRGGRAAASLSSIGLIAASGGVAASAPFSLVVFLASAVVWSGAVLTAGREIDTVSLEASS